MKDKLEINKQAYRTSEAIEKYASYHLNLEERYLFKKSTYFGKDKKILDLACGAGRTTVRLYEMGYNVKGIDLSDILIGIAKKRFPYLVFEVGDYSDIHEDDNSFDTVLIAHNGIDYAYPESQRDKALYECRRVLKKGGHLIFSSHNLKSLYCSPYYYFNASRFIWKMKNSLAAFKEKDYILDMGMYTFFGSMEYIISKVENTGFHLVEIVGFRLSKNYFFNRFISPYIHYVFAKQ